MCIIIDMNVMCKVFPLSGCTQPDHEPVRSWVTTGIGSIVYGGSKYCSELKTAKRYFQLMIELHKQGRVRRIDDAAVDTEQAIVEQLICDKRCDDPHLIAIVRASGCRLLCSDDKRADKYIKDVTLYPKPQHPPLIYRSRKHRHLLSKRYVVQLRNTI